MHMAPKGTGHTVSPGHEPQGPRNLVHSFITIRPCPPRPTAPQVCPYVMGKGPVSTSTQLCHLPGMPESKYQQSPGWLAVPAGSGPGLPQEEGQAQPAEISP